MCTSLQQKVSAKQKTRRRRIKDRGGRAPVRTPSKNPFQSSDREMCASPPPTDKSQVSRLAVGKGGARACLKGRPPQSATQKGGVHKQVPGYVPFPRYVHFSPKVGLTASQFLSAAAADGRITLVLMTLRCLECLEPENRKHPKEGSD